MSELQCAYKPFLRWAGGKSWLLRAIPDLFNNLEYVNYHEPFLGGGSIFFALAPKKAFLSDMNPELITTYEALRDCPDLVKKSIKRFSINKDTYYKVRAMKPRKPHTVAARFIYLNRTSFNGIYRVNRSGSYNVPYGHNDKYKFDFERMYQASEALQAASFSANSFINTIDNVSEGDLVFLDPPYTVSHNNNGFIEYNKTLFSVDDQKQLKKYIDDINSRGAQYILTNAAHQVIADIFSRDSRRIDVSRKCLLGGINARRGDTEEYIFTNIPA